MNSEKENSMNKADRADSTSKVHPQQDRNQSGYKSDTTKQGTGTNQPKFDKQSHIDDKNTKDIDAERHPEEQVPDQKEFTKKDKGTWSLEMKESRK